MTSLTRVDLVAQCVSPATFQAPARLVTSAWIEHIPFAFWLVGAHRPRVLVELGTHSGCSYLAFCQQVRQSDLPTRCFAIDTWLGDEHSGFYGEDIFADLRSYHDPLYSTFSRLIRSTFEDAVSQFADGSIDLLHIDGRHFYSDVRNTFEAWRPKLSSRAIVLFHDTEVRDRGFGVRKFWEEISPGFPHFVFTHGSGLGVLGIGSDFAGEDFPLFAAAENAKATAAIRTTYGWIGGRLTRRFSEAPDTLRAKAHRLYDEAVALRQIPMRLWLRTAFRS